MLLLAWIFSSDRRAIRWRTVAWGLGLQLLFAFLVIRFTFGERALAVAGDGVTRMLNNAFAGSSFVFGELGKQHSSLGVIVAFQVLPTIIFISALFAVLYHLGIMQIVIKGFAWVMQRTMKISGAESLNVAASIFMGQTEAPLTIRPFLSGLTGIQAKDLLAAVIMTAPGTILVAKMLVPETETPATMGVVHVPKSEEHKEENLLGAIARGTIDGGQLAFNVGIMLVAFVALIALLNSIFGGIHNWLGGFHIPFPSTVNIVVGAVFSPIAWIIGIPWHDAHLVGNLLGTRTVINEVVAYTLLGQQKAMLDPRSFTIATFALCGFANLSSIGIQIGGIGALIPNRRNELARLGLKAMLAGTMANLMSASIVGILIR